MFGFLKAKNCDYHVNQMVKCSEAAIKYFHRADEYLAGSGFGDGNVKVQSAKGALMKGQKKLKEALWNYKDGVKDMDSNSDYDKQGLAIGAMKFNPASAYQFESEEVMDLWERDTEWLQSEFKKIFDYESI